MRQILIDQYGRPSWNCGFRNASNRPSAYKIDSQENVCYLKYDAETESAITRITTADGVSTVEIAFGNWNDRASLVYQEVNKPLLVPSDKVASIWARI